MNILICTKEREATLILEGVKDYFLQKFPQKEFEWKASGTMLTTTLPMGEKEITEAFEELVKKYPRLHVEALDSCDIREDDRSAQWWRTVRIYSEKENGETKIVSSASTYWN